MSAAPSFNRGAKTVRAHDPEALAIAESLPITGKRLRAIVRDLSEIGSCDLGYRVTGTPEDKATAEYVASNLRRAGLDGCGTERVRVDGWRLSGASVAIAGGKTYQATSFGGVPGTGPRGITARFVDVGRGDRKALEGMDLAGAVVLCDWDRAAYPPRLAGLELGRRGVRAIVINCPPGGPYYQAPNALGAFDSGWHDGAPPFVLIRKEHAADIRKKLAGGDARATVTLDAKLSRDAVGYNSIGYLGDGDPRKPIVIGAHHDGWNHGAWDNATGVASLIVMAEALQQAGINPRHRMAFSSRTGEEYGMVGSDCDWCVGAWEQVAHTHPDWGANAAFHLCLEASGHPTMRMIMLTPPDLARWARGACRTGEAKGWLDTGWYSDSPSTGTEQWPFLIRGVPGVTAFNWDRWFEKALYHTQFDTLDALDFNKLEKQVRFFSYLLLMADRDPDGILNHADRARHLKAAVKDCGVPTAGIERAAERHGKRKGRAAFTKVGTELSAVDSSIETCYPHTQFAKDLRELNAARTALMAEDDRRAARHLLRVGDNKVAALLSRDAHATHLERRAQNKKSEHWVGASHLPVGPNLWDEIASLQGIPQARAKGPWIQRSLDRHIARIRKELQRVITAMQRALD